MGEKKTWNNVAEMYNDKFMSMNFYNASYDKFCSLLPPNVKVLEVGCGPGVITKYLNDKRPDLSILATDYAPNMIEIAQQNVPNAEFKVLDARQLNTINQSFNAVVAGFILPFFTKEDVLAFFQTCNSLILNNGPLYFSFVEGKFEDSVIKKGSNGNELLFHYFEREFIGESLANNNFRLVEDFKIQYPLKENKMEVHTVLIVEKTD